MSVTGAWDSFPNVAVAKGSVADAPATTPPELATAALAANARASGRTAVTLGLSVPTAGTLSCPRHFFSSHSTHSARPVDTGKPQASHLCSFLNTGGTWLSSASSALPTSLAGFSAADQNSAFFAATASAAGAVGGTIEAFSKAGTEASNPAGATS